MRPSRAGRKARWPGRSPSWWAGSLQIWNGRTSVLAAMGRTITHLGPIGSGQIAKAVNQVILCGTYLAVAEGVVLAMKAGMDTEALLEALAGGAAGSWVLQQPQRAHDRGRLPARIQDLPPPKGRGDRPRACPQRRRGAASRRLGGDASRTASSPRATARTTTRRSPDRSAGSPGL